MTQADRLDRWSTRFAGITRLYGDRAKALIDKHLVVIGIGGVGSWAAEALARSGVGEITLIDLDDVCISNSNRQTHAMHSTVGLMKVEVMAQRLRDINPDCLVHAVQDFITPGNTATLLSQGIDGVLDCIDSANVKAHLLNHCKRHKIQVVTTAGAGGRTDPTQIRVSDLNKTTQDRLSAKVRSTLRRKYGFSRTKTKRYGLPCVHSTEQPSFYMPDGSVSREPGEVRQGGLDCDGGLGASSMVAGSFGLVAAGLLVRRVLDKHQEGEVG